MSITKGEELYRRRHGRRVVGDQADDKQAAGLDRGRLLYLARGGDQAARERLVTWEDAPPEPTDITPGGDAA